MNLNPTELLNPVFYTLDGMIENNVIYFYLVFVWLALLAIGWIFSGGLRNRIKINSLHGCSRNHLADVTYDAISTANHRHRG